jgi:hypothetical protein
MGRVLLERRPETVEVDEELLAEAIQSLEAVPFKTDPLTVILACDLAQAAEECGHSMPVRLEPLGGHLLGLVIDQVEQYGGRTVVLIGATHLRPGSDATHAAELAAEYVHFFAHEGWHVVQSEEGESSGVLLARLHERDDEGYPFGHMAIEAVNEYRVELAIPHSRGRAEKAHLDRIEDLLDEVQAALDADHAVTPEARSSEWHQRLSDHLHDLFGFLGALAALQELDSQSVDLARLQRHEYWGAVVGTYWQPLRAILANAKPASERMTPDELDGVVNLAGTLIREWLPERLGFTITVEPDGHIAGYTRHIVFDTVAVEPL